MVIFSILSLIVAGIITLIFGRNDSTDMIIFLFFSTGCVTGYFFTVFLVSDQNQFKRIRIRLEQLEEWNAEFLIAKQRYDDCLSHSIKYSQKEIFSKQREFLDRRKNLEELCDDLLSCECHIFSKMDLTKKQKKLVSTVSPQVYAVQKAAGLL